MTTALTLASYSLLNPRCSRCGNSLPERAEIETYSTLGGEWITARCPECKHWTPFRIEGPA